MRAEHAQQFYVLRFLIIVERNGESRCNFQVEVGEMHRNHTSCLGHSANTRKALRSVQRTAETGVYELCAVFHLSEPFGQFSGASE